MSATTNPEAPIVITEAAAAAILGKAEKRGRPGQSLRVKVKGGGCSGATYTMSYEDGPAPDGDFVTTQHGATVIVDARSVVFLKNSTLDFKADLMSQRFVWTNPQAKSTCGCGESFSI